MSGANSRSTRSGWSDDFILATIGTMFSASKAVTVTCNPSIDSVGNTAHEWYVKDPRDQSSPRQDRQQLLGSSCTLPDPSARRNELQAFHVRIGRGSNDEHVTAPAAQYVCNAPAHAAVAVVQHPVSLVTHSKTPLRFQTPGRFYPQSV